MAYILTTTRVERHYDLVKQVDIEGLAREIQESLFT
jgi:hypothetical protein